MRDGRRKMRDHEFSMHVLTSVNHVSLKSQPVAEQNPASLTAIKMERFRFNLARSANYV